MIQNLYKKTKCCLYGVSLVIFGACMNPSEPGPSRAGRGVGGVNPNSDLLKLCKNIIESEGTQASMYRCRFDERINTMILYEHHDDITKLIRDINLANDITDLEKRAMLKILFDSLHNNGYLKRRNGGGNKYFVFCLLSSSLSNNENILRFLAEIDFLRGDNFLKFIWETYLETSQTRQSKQTNAENARVIVNNMKEQFSFPAKYPAKELMLELLKINNMSSERLIWCLLSLGASTWRHNNLPFNQDVSNVLKKLWDDRKNDQASNIVHFLFEGMFNQRDVELNRAFGQSVIGHLLKVYSGYTDQGTYNNSGNREMCLKVMKTVEEAMKKLANKSKNISYRDLYSFISGCIDDSNERLKNFFEANFQTPR